ncbi:MAG: isocitrate lyase/phosphoenolpyruvate mutase family protein [Pseudolabrys sp.]
MQRRAAVIVPGAANALFARAIEDLGFEAVYVTGAGIANMGYGVPDVGLTTVTEVANAVAAMADCVRLPLIVDADTGFGNAVNMHRTVKLLERAGASALQIEDQIFPKKCGHSPARPSCRRARWCRKSRPRSTPAPTPIMQIVARTDSRAVEGLDAALDRAHKFVEAGADVIFVEAPLTLEEIMRVATEIKVPQIINIVYGGKTPDLGREKLTELGFSVALYANAALQAALRSVYDVLGQLKETGSLDAVKDKLASFDERQRVVQKDVWDALEAKFRE